MAWLDFFLLRIDIAKWYTSLKKYPNCKNVLFLVLGAICTYLFTYLFIILSVYKHYFYSLLPRKLISDIDIKHITKLKQNSLFSWVRENLKTKTFKNWVNEFSDIYIKCDSHTIVKFHISTQMKIIRHSRAIVFVRFPMGCQENFVVYLEGYPDVTSIYASLTKKQIIYGFPN